MLDEQSNNIGFFCLCVCDEAMIDCFSLVLLGYLDVCELNFFHLNWNFSDIHFFFVVFFLGPILLNIESRCTEYFAVSGKINKCNKNVLSSSNTDFDAKKKIICKNSNSNCDDADLLPLTKTLLTTVSQNSVKYSHLNTG